MNPMLIMALFSLVKGVASGIKSKNQKGEADRMERDNPRPTESVPQSVVDATDVARLMSNVGMPKAQYDVAERNIQRSGTQALAAARDRRSGVDATSTIQQAMNDATLNLDAKSSEMRQQSQLNLINTLQNLGQWQDKIWQYNSGQKFMENAAAIRALKGASAENANSAWDSVLSGAANYASGMKTNTGSSGGGISTGGGIDPTSVTGGVQANKAILDAGKPEAVSPGTVYDSKDLYQDPTLTNPEMFNNGTPDAYMSYLLKLKQLQSAA